MHVFTERAAGERLFVDYAGPTIDVVCPKTGEVRAAQLFVATLGASNYTYVEASWTQSLPDWISSHERTFEFFGGASAQVVSDNLKAGARHQGKRWGTSAPKRGSASPTPPPGRRR
jgi:transposase